jgi:hypothetical protein
MNIEFKSAREEIERSVKAAAIAVVCEMDFKELINKEIEEMKKDYRGDNLGWIIRDETKKAVRESVRGEVLKIVKDKKRIADVSQSVEDAFQDAVDITVGRLSRSGK